MSKQATSTGIVCLVSFVEKRLSFAFVDWKGEHLSYNKGHVRWVLDNHKERHQKAYYSIISTESQSNPDVTFRHEQEEVASAWGAGREYREAGGQCRELKFQFPGGINSTVWYACRGTLGHIFTYTSSPINVMEAVVIFNLKTCNCLCSTIHMQLLQHQHGAIINEKRECWGLPQTFLTVDIIAQF